MGIETKTLGMLVDELITTNLKCWFSQEEVMTENDPIKIANAAKRAQELNGRRNQLIRAIDALNGNEQFSYTSKTYMEDKK